MGMLSITSLERWTKEYLMNRGISLLRSDNEGPPKAPLGSPMVLNWQTSVAWKVETKYSTMGQFHYGNTERYYLRDGQRDIWWFEVFCLPFSGTKGPPKGPPGSQTVLNGQTSVPWEVEIKYSTMGWFHYGNTERYLLERWTKEYLLICLLFSGTEDPPKGPQGSPTVLNGQTSVPWEVEIKYSTMGWFHHGNTERYSLERWTKEYLMIWGIFFWLLPLTSH